jgi:hypothetical protein
MSRAGIFAYKKNKPNKDRIREELSNLMATYNPKKVLSLESPKFIMPKLLFDKSFIVYENNTKTYNNMRQTKPKNVTLRKGNIAQFKFSRERADVIYLDFCGAYSGERENILALKDKIRVCKLLIVTFSPREPRQKWCKINDFSLSVVGRMQKELDMDLRIKYGEIYRDYPDGPMVTIAVEPKVNIQL